VGDPARRDEIDAGLGNRPDGFRGDTATNVTKPAKLETGATVQVPLFVESGDVIRIDTRDRRYIGRAS